ncbi:MAG: Polyketide cyclase / dehydrase and lipid transport [Myxococcales bacterium]|nr:Polyketide cyclase / dehydrase and lipid transport [Myxococcales bacterium]
MRLLSLAMFPIVASAAYAQPNLSIQELPGHRTEATIDLDAPPAAIYAAMTDYAHWKTFLTDVASARVLSGGREDAKLRTESHVLGSEVTIAFRNTPNTAMRFTVTDGPPGARGGGELLLMPLDNGTRTRVRAVLYLEVVGLPGWFVSDSRLRNMREAKLRRDLGDLARTFRSAT